MTCVLIVGGAGAFGQRIARRLCKHANLELVIAGRNLARANAVAQSLSAAAPRPLRSAQLDARTATSKDISARAARVVINASGPYQTSSYNLAESAIAAGAHYIDLADARAFVTGITKLNERAQERGIAVISGASSVPGLSSTVITHLAQDFAHLNAVEIGISPGADFDPGLATTQSVLRGVGRPISVYRNQNWQRQFGWQNLSRRAFGHLGKRWLANVDVPDLKLIPEHYPEIDTVTFQAGLEISLHHFGLWGLSGLVRTGLIRQPENIAGLLLALRRWTKFLGSNRGGMRVAMHGLDDSRRKHTKLWTLVATDGHGPYVPTLASTILTHAIARGTPPPPGAYPCYSLFSYADIEKERSGLSITCTIESRVR